MENNAQFRKIRKVIIICMLVFFAVFGIAVFSFVQIGSLKRQNAKADEKISALQSQKQQLEQNLENANSENYADSVARENDMIKNGETIYYFE